MLRFLYLLAKDFVYLFLRLILWCFVVFGLAMLTKFFWSDSFGIYFDTADMYILNVIRFSALGVCGCAAALAMFMSVFVPAQWFAENMFSYEGMLTHTLPVYPSWHVISKAAAAFIMNVIMMCAVIISVFAFKEGIDYFDDILSAVNDVVSGEEGAVNVTSVIVNGVFSVIALCFAATSICFLSMSMGQLVSRFRNLFIFVCFWGLLAVALGVFVGISVNNNLLDITVIDGMQGLVGFANKILYTIIGVNIAVGLAYNTGSALLVTYKLNL